MIKTMLQGRKSGSFEAFNPQEACRPNPLIRFAPVTVEDRLWYPNPSDVHALSLLRRVTETKISFVRAYRGFRISGAREEKELGEGRAFLRWLDKYKLSIAWKEQDFTPHPYFCQKDSPRHDPYDEMASGLSFAVKPVTVSERKVKLYIQDKDIISLLNLPYGEEEDFIELVMRYVALRFKLETWRAPAPYFLHWVTNQGIRPVFDKGQLGFDHPILPRPCDIQSYINKQKNSK